MEFPLVILTPDHGWFAGSAVSATVPGQDGEFGVMARHISMVGGLNAGVATVRVTGGKLIYFAVDGGVLGVDKDGVRILAGRVVPCDSPERARAAAAILAREA